MTERQIRRRAATTLVYVAALALAACSGGGFSGNQSPANPSTGPGKPSSGPAKLTIMIGSSGAAETNEVTAAANAWAKKSGNTAEVIAASDLAQQLGQGFAGGTPPDVFYLDSALLGDYALAGNLYAYGDQVKDENFLPRLVETFTYNGKFYCAPKDFSTLGLVINTDMWKAAGLTDADIPTDWAGLETVAKKLTKGSVTGLVIGNDVNRSGAFMKQAGGWLVSADGKTMTADDPKNLEGLNEVKKLMSEGVLKFNTDTSPGTGWGGEAFGKGIAAMTIEGNWIRGAMTKDYPKIKYQVAELPAGPAGKGTLLFNSCWGIAAKSAHKSQAVDLVKYLTSVDQLLAAAKAYGPMPSTQEGLAKFKTEYPQDAAFAAGAEYGQGPVAFPGQKPVMDAFNAKLATLSKGGDPKTMLAELQKNGEAVLKGT